MRLLILTCAAAAVLCGAEPLTITSATVAPEAAQESPQPWLGVALGEVDDAVAYHLGLERDLGVMVEQVIPGSPAEQSGLRRFDVIVGLDGNEIYTPRALTEMIQKQTVGARIRIQIRRGAETMTLDSKLAKRPAMARPSIRFGGGSPALDGIEPPPEARQLLDQLREQQANGRKRGGRVQIPQGSLEWSTSEDKPDQEF